MNFAVIVPALDQRHLGTWEGCCIRHCGKCGNDVVSAACEVLLQHKMQGSWPSPLHDGDRTP